MIGFGIVSVLGLGCSGSPAPETEERAATAAAVVDLDDPATCAGCHSAIVAEWGESMHARAHHDNDPVFAALREARMAKEGEAIAAACANCHNPRSPADTTTAAAQVGVSCAGCHAVASVGEGRGAAALLTAPEGVLYGPHDLAEGVSPAHGTGPSPKHFADGASLCLACHDATKTPNGLAACTTGPEHRDGGSGQSCVDCHMPRVAGPSGAVSTRADHASHQFLGPHRAWLQDDPSFLAGAVDVQLAAVRGEATVTLVNQSGHGFPTGFPGRMAVLTVVGRDAAGAEAATHSVVLGKRYTDDAGHPVAPPFATKLAADTRLTANETRTVDVALPAGVASVEATLAFRLLPPPLAEKVGLADAPEAQPRVIARRAVDLR